MSRRLNGRYATRAIHIGQEPEPGTGAVVPPVYQTTTYAQDDFGGGPGGVGVRGGAPNMNRGLGLGA